MKMRKGPWGIHLFDRASGLNVLVDEVKCREEEWAIAPRYVSIALTNACDLHCEFCYAPKDPARLKGEEVLAWAKQLDAGGSFGVGLGGGEPTIHPHFAWICEAIKSETQLSVSFTTHGHHLSDAMLARIRPVVDFVRVSMDGVGETYEAIRRRSFEALLERLHGIASCMRLGINFVVNDRTVRDLDAAAGVVEEVGAKELLLLPEIGDDGTLNVSPSTRSSLERWVAENQSRLRLSMSAIGSEHLRVPVLPIRYERPTDDLLHIDAMGTLKPSAFVRGGVEVRRYATILDAICELRSQIQ